MMGGTLRLRLLGIPEICVDDIPLVESIPGKARAILYYLAVTGQPQTRSALAGLLWGDMPEAAARSNLRKALASLRRSVGSFLDIDRRTVAFKSESSYWVDVADFIAEVGDASSTVDKQRLQEAANLYRGDFLEGFYVLHAPDFEFWVLAERTRLNNLVIQALHTLVAGHAEQGALSQAIAYARRLLSLEPWREEAHRQLMFLLARSGQRSAALAQYETCRRVLLQELDVEPGVETTALYENIRDGEISGEDAFTVGSLLGTTLLPRRDVSLPVQRLTPRHNLPLQLTGFIGREVELAALDELIADPAVRLVTITGQGGIGKTRLALAAAERQLTRSGTNLPSPAAGPDSLIPDGVFFVSLTPLSSVDQIVPSVAKALDFRLETEPTSRRSRSPQQQLLDYLGQKRLLLILDNFEHLIIRSAGEHIQGKMNRGAGLLVDVMQMAPEVKILVTSRERLHLRQEQVYPIQGLEFPDVETSENPGEYPAVQLFLQNARRVQPDFGPGANELIDLIRICRLVEGMPLGIELAASWVDMLSLADIAAEIQRSLDFLETDVRNVPERHRSIRAVFDTSWQRLSDAERNVFSQISAFQGGFTRQAAQEVTGASLRLLATLASKSLLHYRKTGDRYEIHELLRQYAADKLAEDASREAKVRDRHSTYYCAALGQLEADLKGARQRAALAGIETEIENARAGWDWAVAQGQIERLDQALEGLGLFYEWRGRYQEGEAAFYQAAQKLTATESGDEQRILTAKVLARLLAWQSVFGQALGRLSLASQLLVKSLDLCDNLGLSDQDTRLERAFILLEMGCIADATGDRQEAKRLLEQSLGLYQELGDEWGMANILQELSQVVWNLGAYNEAQRLAEECLTLRQRLGDRKGIAKSLDRLGLIAVFDGRIEESKQFLRESVTIYHELGDLAGVASATGNLGSAFKLSGDFVQARDYYEQAVAIFSDLTVRHPMLAEYRAQIGHAIMHLGRYEEAKPHIQTSLKLAIEIGDQHRRSIALALVFLGETLLAGEEYAQAQQRLRKGVTIYRAIGQQAELAWALSDLGLAAYGLGYVSEAERLAYEALQIVAATPTAVFVVAHAIAICAYLLASEGVKGRAVELYALASRYSYVANSHWFENVIGQHLAAAAATLPPKVAREAQARGQMLDLWQTMHKLLEELPKQSWRIAEAGD